MTPLIHTCNSVPIDVAVKGVKAVIDALASDHDHYYGLIRDIDYGDLDCSPFFQPFSFDSDVLSFYPSKEKPGRIHTVIHQFPPERKIWDGTTAFPDATGVKLFSLDVKLKALLLASLPHDVFYELAEAIVKAAKDQGLDVKSSQVFAFADALLSNLNDVYGGSKGLGRSIHGFLRAFGGLYHRLNKALHLSVVVVSLGLLLISGCAAPWILDPDWTPERPDMTEAIHKSDLP